MIVTSDGNITYRGGGFVVVESNGIGYKVHIPEEFVYELSESGTYYVHEAIRDSERELFGFPSLQALELFWRLTNVSGVGARTAQKIVFSGSIDRVKRNIMAGDRTFLKSVKGVGKKTAQKIILELKGVLTEEPTTDALDGEAIDALESLGYSRRHAQEALSEIEAKSTEARVKAALKLLGK